MFFSVSSASPGAEETVLSTPLSSTQKTMWDFNPHTFINMPLRTRHSYWVKCWVTFEFREKPRKTSCINKSMQTAEEAQSVAGWICSLPLVAYSVPRWHGSTASLSNTSLMEGHWVRCCLSLPHTHAHNFHHLMAAQACFITLLYSPWRRPKSLWASVSCFRCSVMEICQREIKIQLDWYIL